jgi:septum formation protein
MPDPAAELILASGSPRRAEILDVLGFRVRVHPSDALEEVLPEESPEAHAERLARAKAAAVADLHPDRWVLAGDTIVADAGDILGKPRDPEEAVAILLRLQGRSHRVVSALALVRPTRVDGAEGPRSQEDRRGGAEGRTLSGFEVTTVSFRPFDRSFAEGYVRTGEAMDKAGAYGIQGKGAALVRGIEGDYTTVVGLPVSLLLRLLEAAGRPYDFGVSDNR